MTAGLTLAMAASAQDLVKCNSTKNGKIGYCDQDGVVMISQQYDDGEEFYEGTAPAKKNGFWGVLNLSGKDIVPFQYGKITRLPNNNFLAMTPGEKFGIISSDGRVLLDFRYTDPKLSPSETEKATLVFRDESGKFGLVTQEGKVLVPFDYDYLEAGESFDEGKLEYYTSIACGKSKGRYGLVDLKGKQVTDFSAPDFLGFWDEHYAVFKDDQTISFTAFPELTETDSADIASRPLFACRSREMNRVGMVDQTTNIIVPFEYDDITVPPVQIRTYKCVYLLLKEAKKGLADFNGHIIIPPVYEDLFVADKEAIRIFAQQNGKWGLMDKSGKEITAFKYDSIKLNTKNELEITLGNKSGKLTLEGKEEWK